MVKQRLSLLCHFAVKENLLTQFHKYAAAAFFKTNQPIHSVVRTKRIIPRLRSAVEKKLSSQMVIAAMAE